MSQLEKLFARLKSLDDGFTTITLYKKNGEIFCWSVSTLKAEGESGKIEDRKEV